jgi:hypothetical protein
VKLIARDKSTETLKKVKSPKEYINKPQKASSSTFIAANHEQISQATTAEMASMIDIKAEVVKKVPQPQ